MKIIKRINEESKIILKMDTIDDLWYLKNVLNPGDEISVTVYRRVEQNDDLNRPKSTERKRIRVELRIEKIDFQPYTDKLKILGEIISGENIGSHQSVFIGQDDEITVIKNMDSEENKLIEEAVNNYYKNSIVFISLDDEKCLISLLKSYGLQDIGEINSNRSGKDYESKPGDATYFNEIIKTIKTIKNVSSFIILGPGFEHTKLYNAINKDPYFKDIKIYDFPETDSGKRGIYIFMDDKKSENILKESRIAGDEKLIERFLTNLNKNNLSVYGYDEIKKYAVENMIEDLIISEAVFKDPKTRELLNTVTGTDIHVISDYTDSGSIIRNFGGYCAILRYNY